MRWELMFPNEYLKAADLQGKEPVLTISRLNQEELKSSDGDSKLKWTVFFKEMEERCRRDKKQINKRLVLSKTTAKTIAKIYRPETNDWVGKQIQLYQTTCMAFGEEVDCIRIRPSIPKKRGAAPAPEHAEPADDVERPDEGL
jgi:hypothetical protein